MMQFMRVLCGLLFAALVTACGGGGGSSGTTTGGGSQNPAAASITLEIVDGSGVATTTIGSATPVYARATAKDAAGAVMAGVVVTFSSESGLLRFEPATGTALTGSNGIALIQVLPVASTSAGAGTLKAEATLGTTLTSQVASFQVPSGVSDQPTSKVANFVMLLDRSSLANAGTSTAALTVVAVDANNNVVAGAAVNVSTNANSIFTPSGTVTNSSGQFTGQISAGSDKSDRTIVITTTINGIVKQTSLQVAGSQISITATPSIFSPGGAATITARLTDSASQPQVGKVLSFTGDFTAVAGRQATTDSNGTAVIGFTAPAVAGSYLVGVSGSGVTNQVSVQVGSSATIPVAVIPAGAQGSLAAVPNVVSPNAAGSTTNQSQLRFLFLDSQNKPIPNVRVRFDITSTGLGSFDSVISSGASTVYTNSSGVATAAFIPGATGSPTDGVVVRACYQSTDFTSVVQCVNSVSAHLTIAAQALAVSIGDDNILTSGPGTYIKKFVVTVADAAGRAVADAPVDISLDITHYGKGLFAQTITFPLDLASANTYVPDATTTPAAYMNRVSCINEDFNRNGFVDPGENVNGSIDSFGQPTLEPRRSDMVVSYASPSVKTTNASGVLLIQVEYSQRFGTWLAYRVRATTTVAGSQGSAERAFITDVAISDLGNGSFLTPPYGTGACNAAN